MQQFKRRQTKRAEYLHVALQVLGMLALLLVAFVSLRAAWGMYGKLAEATAGQEKAEAHLLQLKDQQARVSRAVAELTSKRGLEAEVRERYGVAKPGEGEIQIVAAVQQEATTTPHKPGFWESVWHALWVW